MKKLKYGIIGHRTTHNRDTGSDEQVEIVITVNRAWSEEAEASAREVAVGEVVIYDDGKPEPVPPAEPGGDSSVWDELDAAYQAGYSEGYQEGVNTAYDQ